MPHSVASEMSPIEIDMMAEEAEPMKLENQNQDTSENEQDMTIAEPGIEGAETEQPDIKQDVKLEDLFADVESDEEFPSSNVQDDKIPSSPEVPTSPM